MAHLRTEPAKPDEVSGTYSLYLYGCRYPDDLEDVAILVKEGGPFTVDIFSLPTMYKMKEDLTADQALAEAKKFVMCSVHYQQTRYSRILGPDGSVVAYEVRPLYSPIRFGMHDVLDIQYALKGSVITVYIKLDRDVEMNLRGDGHRDRDRM